MSDSQANIALMLLCLLMSRTATTDFGRIGWTGVGLLYLISAAVALA